MIDKWKRYLGLDDWAIVTQEINKDQVVYPNDIHQNEKFFVGISMDQSKKRATIYHDRPLTDEHVIHELLHVVNPSKDEDWINARMRVIIQETNTIK